MHSPQRQSLHLKIRLFALMLFAGSLPFAWLLINNIAIYLLIVNWLFESPFAEKWQRLRQKPMVPVFIIPYFLYALGMMYSDNHRQGFFELEKKLSLLAFPIIIGSTTPFTKRDLSWIFKSFVVFSALATLTCYSYAVYLNYKEGHTLSYVYNAVFRDIHLPGHYDYFNYWYFTYELFAKPIGMHPVYLAMHLVFACCLAVWLWWDAAWIYKKRNLLLLAYLLYNFITVVLLSSRTQLGILLALALCFIFYQAYLRKKLLAGLLAFAAIVGIGLAFILLNPVSRERFIESNKPGQHFSQNKYGEGGLSLRLYKWRYTLQTIGHNPLLGTGTGDTQDELQKTYQANNFEIGYNLRYNAHNQFLQILLEIGLIGLAGLLASLLLPVRIAVKHKQWLYLMLLIIFSVSCLTESMLEANKGIAFFAFFNSLLAWYHKDRESLR